MSERVPNRSRESDGNHEVFVTERLSEERGVLGGVLETILNWNPWVRNAVYVAAISSGMALAPGQSEAHHSRHHDEWLIQRMKAQHRVAEQPRINLGIRIGGSERSGAYGGEARAANTLQERLAVIQEDVEEALFCIASDTSLTSEQRVRAMSGLERIAAQRRMAAQRAYEIGQFRNENRESVNSFLLQIGVSIPIGGRRHR